MSTNGKTNRIIDDKSTIIPVSRKGQETNIENSLARWKLLSALIKIKRDPLLKEQQQLTEETHPSYTSKLARYSERYEREKKLIDMTEQDEIARIEAAYNQQIESLEKEYKCRLNELVDTLLHELEENKRQLDGEIMALEIARKDGGFNTNSNMAIGSTFSNTQNSQWFLQSGQGMHGKKQLRRRPNEISTSSAFNVALTNSMSLNNPIMDSNSSGGAVEKKGRKRSPGAGQSCPLITQTLLPAQAIADDVEKYCSATNMDQYPTASSLSLRNSNSSRTNNDQSTNSNIHNRMDVVEYEDEDRLDNHKRISKVHLEQGKLLCDGKTFLRGQTVFLKSTNTGCSMQATVMQINELTVQFRSRIPGDTRTVTATKEDLENRRVVVRKRH